MNKKLIRFMKYFYNYNRSIIIKNRIILNKINKIQFKLSNYKKIQKIRTMRYRN